MAATALDVPLPYPPSHTSELQVSLLGEDVLELVGFRCALPSGAPYVPDQSDPLFLYEFHQLGWLVGALARLDRNESQAQRLVDWLEAYADYEHPSSSPYWDAYPLAARLLGLLPLHAMGRLRRPAIERALHSWSLAILGLQETHLLGNHLLRSRAAAAAASLFLEGVVARNLTTRVWRALAREAEKQFLPDGVHEERTPAYHLLCLSDLLVCLALSRSVRFAAPQSERERVERVAERALAAADVFTHEDGRVAAFGDSAPDSALRPADLLAFAEFVDVRARGVMERNQAGDWERRTARDGGFSVIRRAGVAIYLSHGAFGAVHQPGHAHCDLFAFELDVDGQRVIVDPGVHAYHEVEWRGRSRASAEHATPSLRDREQAEIWSRFRCGWRPRVEQTLWQQNTAGWIAEMRAIAFGPEAIPLRRTLELHDNQIVVTDTLPAVFSVALPLAPEVEVNTTENGAVLMHPRTRRRILLRLACGRLAIEPCFISHSFGAKVPSRRLRLFSEGNARLSWSLRA